MSYERSLPYEPLDLSNLMVMAADAQTVYTHRWEDLLLDPDLFRVLVAPVRDMAKRILDGWACGFIAAESYIVNDPENPEPIDDTSLCYVGRLKDVDACRLKTGEDIPNFGEVPASISLFFEPAEVVTLSSIYRSTEDIEEPIRLAELPEDVAIPLLPRFASVDREHLQICRIQPVQH